MRATQTKRHAFTLDEFARMGEAGIFSEKRTELIEGEVVDLGPIGLPHAACVRRLNNFLTLGLGDRAIVDVQNPFILSELSQPQPDLTLLSPKGDFYRDSHPRPGDIQLVIEVSDSSLTFDREVKGALYAKGGISEVWLVDLGGSVVEVYRDPSPEGYLDVATKHPGQSISPQAYPDLHIAISQVLG